MWRDGAFAVSVLLVKKMTGIYIYEAGSVP